MFTRTWFKDAAERALKTFAQTLLAALGAGAIDILAVNWVGALSVSGGAALVSVLMSIGSEPFGQGGTASLTKAVEPARDGAVE